MDALNMWESNIVLYVQENLRFDWLNPIMKFITSLGDLGLLPIVVILFLLCYKKTRKVGFMGTISLVLESLLINLCIKPFVGRPRPFAVNEAIEYIIGRPSDKSFPSGHTGAVFAVASVLLFMLPKKVGIPAMVIATLIGFSRVYVGVHYPTDILGGFLIGMLTGFIAKIIVETIHKKRAVKKEA